MSKRVVVTGTGILSPIGNSTQEFLNGLKSGDNWCVCAGTYAQSIDAGTACKVYLKKTNQKTLEIIPLAKLKKYAIDLS